MKKVKHKKLLSEIEKISTELNNAVEANLSEEKILKISQKLDVLIIEEMKMRKEVDEQ